MCKVGVSVTLPFCKHIVPAKPSLSIQCTCIAFLTKLHYFIIRLQLILLNVIYLRIEHVSDIQSLQKLVQFERY